MTIVTNGKNLILDMTFGLNSQTKINSMGVGNSATASSATQTQLLGSTPSPVLQALDGGFPSRSGSVVTCQSTFGPGVATQTWQEVGLFNGTTNGTSVMLNRIAPIGPYTKNAGDTIIAILTITQS